MIIKAQSVNSDKTRTINILFLVLVSFILIFIGVYYYYTRKNSKTLNNNQNPEIVIHEIQEKFKKLKKQFKNSQKDSKRSRIIEYEKLIRSLEYKKKEFSTNLEMVKKIDDLISLINSEM